VAELEKSFGNRVSQLDDLSKSVSNKVYGSMNRVPAASILSKRILPKLGKLLPVDLLKSIVAHESAIAIDSAHEKYGKPEVIRNLRAKAWGNIGLAFQALEILLCRFHISIRQLNFIGSCWQIFPV